MTYREVAREAFYDALLEDDPVELYDRAPCGYLSTTPGGGIVKVNETFLAWTGYQRTELLQRSLVDLLTPGGRLYHETHYAPMLRLQRSVREIALDVIRADGSMLPVLVNASLEVDNEGTPTVVRVALFDATERREYERELVRAKERAEVSEERAQELARTLQHTLLPPSDPAIPGFDVAAAFRPAIAGIDIGGDFYDVFQVAEGDWVVVIGDVCGKGVEAAVVTSLVRHALRAIVVGRHVPSEALSALNQVLLQHETDRFCTVVLMRLQRAPRGWLATISSGGHPRPYLLGGAAPPRRVGGQGPLIGVQRNPSFHDEQLLLELGDTLVLYTDGVTECRGENDYFGEDRLVAALAEPGTASDIIVRVVDEVVAFSDGPPRDDIALLALRPLPR